MLLLTIKIKSIFNNRGSLKNGGFLNENSKTYVSLVISDRRTDCSILDNLQFEHWFGSNRNQCQDDLNMDYVLAIWHQPMVGHPNWTDLVYHYHFLFDKVKG